MRLSLLAFGKLKNPGLRAAADHYLELARPWIRIEEIELKAEPLRSKAPPARKLAQAKEAVQLLDRAQSRMIGASALYLLDETGASLSTLEWAELVRGWEREGCRQVIFCVGSSAGFAPEVRQKAKAVLSLGRQTLSHELSRVVLLEQLYRAWSVVRGHPYHNEG